MTEKAFPDHFSRQASAYARARPTYPPDLFAWLAQQCSSHSTVWDCATGSGQAALALTEYFDTVIATDASAAQLAQAPAHPRIQYHCASAEESGLADCSVDLVTVAQALHWFDVERFYTEAQRVSRPDGLIAVWTYGRLEIDDASLDDPMQRFYDDRIAPCWPAERSHIEDRYARLPFPFERISAPSFHMTVEWPLSQLLDYVRSWSAAPVFIARHGIDPALELEALLKPIWGSEDALKTVRWPLTLQLGHVHRRA